MENHYQSHYGLEKIVQRSQESTRNLPDPRGNQATCPSVICPKHTPEGNTAAPG